MTEDEVDNFKPIFKYYKSKAPPPNLKDVLCFKGNAVENGLSEENFSLGLKNPKYWSSPSFLGSGLVIQPDPFTHRGKLEWALRCLRDYTVSPPYETNLEGVSLPWSHRTDGPSSLYEKKLRWATLGFHHNWDTKEYNLSQRNASLPSELSELSSFLIQEILKKDDFEPQAAIVNFYPPSGNLSPHTDHSEPNTSAPLLSISLGQSAIFLIGGKSKAEKPEAIFLRHGDVLIMTEGSRLSYHAVPRIFLGDAILKGSQELNEEYNFAAKYLVAHRININVRQVL